MLSGAIGVCSPGQMFLGAIGVLPFSPPIVAVPRAPFDRTFTVPQNGLLWQGEKTPAEIINFSFDWFAALGCDAIASSAWAVESADISIATNSVLCAGTVATALIAGGVAGNIYNITNSIVTDSGLTLSATFRLLVNPYDWTPA